jgi:DNA-binding NarL/FixJ family response regulator
MVLQITPAERAVLQLLADGAATRDIASRLRLSEPAIDAMVTTLLERMGASSPFGAVADAVRRGLLSTEDTNERSAAGR